MPRHELRLRATDPMDRIPISEGFYIGFSKDGRAISRGREEPEVLPGALFWLRRNEGGQNYQLVEKWIQQKTKQIEEDADVQNIRVRRQEINDAVDKAARESALRDPNLIELVRTATFEANGIPQNEY